MSDDDVGGGEDGGEEPRRRRDEIEAIFRNALVEWDKRKSQIGDTVPAEWFYDMLGVQHPSATNSFELAEAARQNFMVMFHGEHGFRAYLLRHRKRYLKSNYAGGYEVLDPEQQTKYAQKQRRADIHKALKGESFLLQNVDMEHLSEKKRQENSDALAHNAALSDLLHRRKPGFGK
jgi:hypothetical protein